MALIPEEKYAYAVARTRVLELGLLDQARIERLLGAQSLEEALRLLGETDYGDALGALGDPYAYEEALAKFLLEAYETIEEMAPDPLLIASLRWRYDFLNIKMLLRAELAQGDAMEVAPSELTPLGTYPAAAMRASAWQILPELWQQAIARAQERYAETQDPQVLDLILDQALYRAGLALAKRKKAHFLVGWWRTQIDLVNIRTFFRFQAMGAGDAQEFMHAILPEGYLAADLWQELAGADIEALPARLASGPYAELVQAGVQAWKESGSLAEWERLSDNYLLRYLKQAKYVAFGLEPLVAFVLAREFEVKVLRIVLAGKASGATEGEIRERLRELYG